MRKRSTWFCLLVGLFWTTDVYSTTDPSIINDAAFSPNGKTIGVATNSGFQLLDMETKMVIYSFLTGEEVIYIKWAPDSQRILLVSWQDQETPTYSLLDIQQNRILFSFQDEIRWYYYYLPKEMAGQQEIFEGIYPRSLELGHASSMAYSPDGYELAYITKEGSIRIRNTETGNILRELPLSDYHATSLGYLIVEEKLWVGILLGTETAYIDSTRLLYLDKNSGEILERKQMNYDGQLVTGSSLYWIYSIRSDQKYALAVTGIEYGSTRYYTRLTHYLVDMDQQFPVKTIVDSITNSRAFHRAMFSKSGVIFGLSDEKEVWISNKYDYSILTGVQPNSNYPYRSVPIQPFSPDGSHFLMIDDRILDIVESVTWKHQVVHIGPTQVKDYRQHETNPSMEMKQNEK